MLWYANLIALLSIISNFSMSFVFKTKPQFFFQYSRFSVSKNQINESYMTFLRFIRNKQVDSAVELFQKMKFEMNIEKRKLPVDSYSSLSHLFYKEEHMKFAEQLFTELINDHSQPNEQIYLALLRCSCDAGDIDKAYGLLNELMKLPIEPRLRTYHPLIECLCIKKHNPQGVIGLFKEMLIKGIKPSSEQVCMFLKASLKQKCFQNTTFITEVNNIIDAIGFDLLGLTSDESLQLNAEFTNSTVNEVLDEGILIDDIKNITGSIIEEDLNPSLSNISSTSVYETINILSEDSENDNMIRTSNEVMTVSNNTVLALNLSYVGEQPLVPFEIEMSGHGATLNSTNTTFEYFDRGGFELIPDKYVISSQLENAIARHVEMNQLTCVCPNCGDKVETKTLSEYEKETVRLALKSIVLDVSQVQYEYFRDFESWLKDDDKEYKYIVDAANCAYLRQNFEKGKFSYRQIELIVDKLKQRNDGNILIILPISYAKSDLVPNRTQNRGKRYSQISYIDKKIIEKLCNEHMVYMAPQNINDDWYFLFASVYQKNKYAYVVTNDMIRDHRLAFDSVRTFYRWRSSQIIQFDLTHAAQSDELDELSLDDVILTFPSNFSREVQRTQFSRYHFPILGKKSWLCLNLQ